MSQKDIVLFPQFLQPCLTQIFLQQKNITGHNYGKISYKNLRTGRTLNNIDEPSVDRFVIKIPYAGEHLEWAILFCEENINLAPDFEFSDDTFLNDPDLKTIKENVPSWGKWNIENENSLVDVLKELVQLYKKTQLDILQQDSDSRAHFEYSMLISQTDITEEDIQIKKNNNNVNFLIKLNIDVSRLTELKNINDEKTLYSSLLISICNSTITNVELTLDPNIEKMLDRKCEVQWSNDNCLMDYVSAVIRWIEEEIKNLSKNYENCKEFLIELLTQFRPNITEYDAINFTTAVLLFEKNNNYWFLTVVLDKKFPQVKPKYICQSVQYSICGSPYQEIVSNYPYSSNWTSFDKIQKAMTAIFNNIDDFHNNALMKTK